MSKKPRHHPHRWDLRLSGKKSHALKLFKEAMSAVGSDVTKVEWIADGGFLLKDQYGEPIGWARLDNSYREGKTLIVDWKKGLRRRQNGEYVKVSWPSLPKTEKG